MFPSLRPARSPHRNRATLTLENLETRFCPAAPSILSFGATMMSGNQVTLLGSVQDESPGTVQITFSGVASGTTTANPFGGFALVTTATCLGNIYAVALDNEGLTSSQASTQITSDVPVIMEFTATDLGGGDYEFRGRVVDEDPIGLTVRLTGLTSFGEQGIEVTVSADTWFSVIYNIGTDTGTVQAQTWDAWGQASDPVYQIIR